MAGVVVTVRPRDSICCCAAAGRAGRTKAAAAKSAPRRKAAGRASSPETSVIDRVSPDCCVSTVPFADGNVCSGQKRGGSRRLPPPTGSGQTLAVLGDVQTLALLLLRHAEADHHVGDL